MADTRQALLEALFTALNGNVGAPVYSSVPDNTAPPVVIIDQLSAENIGGKGSPLDQYSVEIVTVVKAKSREPLNTVMAAIRTALEDQTITATGYSFSRPAFLTADESMIDDGVMIGRSRFQVIAQTA